MIAIENIFILEKFIQDKKMKQVILGANGAIGIALARELVNYSADLTLVSRNPVKINSTDTLVSADLTQQQNIEKVIAGKDIVYVTIGFPYKILAWEKFWVPFIQNVVKSCIKNGAKLVFFDNIYAIGEEHIHHITEQSPISPSSKKGKIRARVDEIILQNIESGKLKAIIARAPDFFGGTAKESSLLMNLVFDPLSKGKKAKWFCDVNKIHNCGYVPDLAKGTAMLGNTDEAFNQIWNLPTDSQKITGKDWICLFAKTLGCQPNYIVLPNWLLKTIGIFIPLMKELADMNYQFDRDYFFDSSKFTNYFQYTPTTYKMAVKEVVEQNKITRLATNS